MGKKRVWIIVAIISAVVIACWAVFAIGYPYASRMVNNATRQGFIEECKKYLLSDDDFIDNYGTLISLESENKMPLEDKKAELQTHYMDFVCVTDRGEYDIRVYQIWDDGWYCSYEEID